MSIPDADIILVLIYVLQRRPSPLWYNNCIMYDDGPLIISIIIRGRQLESNDIHRLWK